MFVEPDIKQSMIARAFAGGGKCPFPPWKLGLRTKYFSKNLMTASSIPLNWFDSCNDSFLPVWNSHCTRVRFTVIVSCSDELAVNSCLFLCLQRRFAKVASGLFCCWSLLRNNTVATNLQRFTLYCITETGVLFHITRLLNAHILAGNAARQWHADSGKPRTFVLCEKKHEEVCSNASTSLKNPSLVRVWPMCLSVKPLM